MTEGAPYLRWPEVADRIVVEEMLRDLQSEQWRKCFEFVKKLVQLQANNIPQDHWDDLVQDAMIKINRSLHTFQYHCTLKTWIFGIVRSCIIDDYRKATRARQFTAIPGDSQENLERDGDAINSSHITTVEDACITREALEEAIKALQDYVSTHANEERNRRILDMILVEGSSLEEAGKMVGCSAPVAGYIVRSAQRYVRERFREKHPPL
jgi:RNA polymerase sigma factor (sigma-70 family)